MTEMDKMAKDAIPIVLGAYLTGFVIFSKLNQAQLSANYAETGSLNGTKIAMTGVKMTTRDAIVTA